MPQITENCLLPPRWRPPAATPLTDTTRPSNESSPSPPSPPAFLSTRENKKGVLTDTLGDSLRHGPEFTRP